MAALINVGAQNEAIISAAPLLDKVLIQPEDAPLRTVNSTMQMKPGDFCLLGQKGTKTQPLASLLR